VVIHLTVRAVCLPVRLTDHEVASWLWPRLRQAFPDALSAVLMPSHPHLMTVSEDVEASWRSFKNVISGLRRSSNPGAQIRWEPLGPADILSDAQKVNRMTRYLALNPCRKGLVDDPLRWPWSTHRDVVGAIADPWVDADRLARVLERRGGDFANELHAYISSDPSVCVTGTPFPRPAQPTSLAEQPLEALAAAAAAATRATPADIQRRSPTQALFVQLAARHGWHDTGRLASLCGISPRTVQRYRGRVDRASLAAADLCLGDERLRVWKVGT
jgi:hypothetical protein